MTKLANLKLATHSLAPLLLALTFVPSTVRASDGSPGFVQNPYHDPSPAPVLLDLSLAGTGDASLVDPPYPETTRFDQLDEFMGPDPVPAEPPRTGPALPEGWAQVGGMVVPEAMLHGAQMVPDYELALTGERGPQGADIEEICAFPDEVPPGVYDYDHRPGGETPRFHTVFLNYNGGVLMTGGENSAENMSNIARSGHMYPVFTGGEAKAIAAAQAVQNDLADWAVRVMYETRPPKVLPYTMTMIGGHYSDTTAGPSGGVAPLDCEDFGQRNVCYVFQNSASSTAIANVASQEIGHTLGLGHTTAPDSVMAAGYAPTQGGDLGFNDSCASTVQVSGQSAACVGVNKCHCGTGEEQHDKNTLFATFAPAGVDMVEPTIQITTPADGQEFMEGEEILIQFDPWDDVGGYGWKLIVEDENGEVLVDKVDYDRALEFTLIKVPPGTYTLTALIQDHADHIVTHSITIHVIGQEDGGTGTSGGTDDGGQTDGAESSGTGDGSGGEEGSDTDTDPSVDGDDGGCGCSSSPRRSWWAGLVLLPLCAPLRRQRV